MKSYSIKFTDGTVLASDNTGPGLAAGTLVPPIFAYKKLGNLQGVGGGILVRPSHWHFQTGPKPIILLWATAFENMQMTMVGDWQLDTQMSQFPAQGDQIQVYTGTFLLSWQQTRTKIFGIFSYIGPGGNTTMTGNITLAYPPQLDIINFTGALDCFMQPPVLPEADPQVSGSFGSTTPLRPTDQISTFVVKGLTLSGNWSF